MFTSPYHSLFRTGLTCPRPNEWSGAWQRIARCTALTNRLGVVGVWIVEGDNKVTTPKPPRQLWIQPFEGNETGLTMAELMLKESLSGVCHRQGRGAGVAFGGGTSHVSDHLLNRTNMMETTHLRSTDGLPPFARGPTSNQPEHWEPHPILPARSPSASEFVDQTSASSRSPTGKSKAMRVYK